MKFSSAVVLALTQYLSLRTVNGAGNPPLHGYDVQYLWPEVECNRTNSTGEGQSPIDIPSSDCVDDNGEHAIRLNLGDCKKSDMKFTINNHSVKGAYKGNCTKPSVILPDSPDLVFHFEDVHVHTGCEHRKDGKGCAAEMHMVHKTEDKQNATVIGVRIDMDQDYMHPTFDELLDCWTETQQEFDEACNEGTTSMSRNAMRNATCTDGEFDIYSLIPEGSGYYFYNGSLTTPDCNEYVRWNVMDTNMVLSLKQWNNLANLIMGYHGSLEDDGSCPELLSALNFAQDSMTGSTSRDVQPLLGRTINHWCNGTTVSGGVW